MWRPGHYATERPSKGPIGGKDGGKKGKKGGKRLGKDKGGKYGGKFSGKVAGENGKGPNAGQAGKGRAPMDGSACWHCGGARFAADCTQSGQQQKGGIRSLCGLQIAEMDEDMFNVFLKTSNMDVADISTMGSGGESFYPARRDMLVKGPKGLLARRCASVSAVVSGV